MSFGFVVDMTQAQLEAHLDGPGAGMRVRSIAMYGRSNDPRYAVVQHSGPGPEQRLELGIGLLQGPSIVAAHQADGFYPKAITATGDESGWLYSLLFEHRLVPPASPPLVAWMTAWEDMSGKDKFLETQDDAGSNLVSMDSFWFGQPNAQHHPFRTSKMRKVRRPAPYDVGARSFYYCSIWERSPPTRQAWAVHKREHTTGAWADNDHYDAIRRGWARPESVVPSPQLHAGKPRREILMVARGDTYEPWPDDMDTDAFTGGVECHGPWNLQVIASWAQGLKGRWPIHVGANGYGSNARFCALSVKAGLRGPLPRHLHIVDALDTNRPIHVRSAAGPVGTRPRTTWRSRVAQETADDQAEGIRSLDLMWGKTLARGGSGGGGPSGSGIGPGVEGPGTAASNVPEAQRLPLSSLDDFVVDEMRTRGIRVAHLALSINGRLVFSRAYTWAEERYPIATIQQGQRIGSISKALTGTAVVRDRANLPNGLATPMARALDIPGLDATNPLQIATVEDFLRHRSGLGGTTSETNRIEDKDIKEELYGAPGFQGGPQPLLPALRPGDLQKYLRSVVVAPLFVNPPKLMEEYNNYNFTVLSEVASKLIASNFNIYEDSMRQLVFSANRLLDPHSTTTSWETARKAGDVPCHSRVPGYGSSTAVPYPLVPSQYTIDGTFHLGAGYWVMTATDLVRTISRLDPSCPDGQLLDPSDVPLLYEPYHFLSATFDNRQGRAWRYVRRRFPFSPPSKDPVTDLLDKVPTGRVLFHNGEFEGCGAIAFHSAPPGVVTPSISGALLFNQNTALSENSIVLPLLSLIEDLGEEAFPDVDLFPLILRT